MKNPASSPAVRVVAGVLVALVLLSVLIGAAYSYRIETIKERILMYGTTAQITELLEAGADPNVRVRGQQGQTPLHMAVSNNDAQLVKTLISHSANVNAKNDFNETPLYHAASKLNIEIARVLLENGADVNAKGYGSDTPLDAVFMFHHTDESKEMVALLKDYGGVTQYK